MSGIESPILEENSIEKSNNNPTSSCDQIAGKLGQSENGLQNTTDQLGGKFGVDVTDLQGKIGKDCDGFKKSIDGEFTEYKGGLKGIMGDVALIGGTPADIDNLRPRPQSN